MECCSSIAFVRTVCTNGMTTNANTMTTNANTMTTNANATHITHEHTPFTLLLVFILLFILLTVTFTPVHTSSSTTPVSLHIEIMVLVLILYRADHLVFFLLFFLHIICLTFILNTALLGKSLQVSMSLHCFTPLTSEDIILLRQWVVSMPILLI